ncbi:FAD-binding oxidoreductase [Candidatus Bathyarchaeota archaeon]|nr:FAD-binding oxidoreductase [Candidatus Bathyarchaeota archaeon]
MPVASRSPKEHGPSHHGPRKEEKHRHSRYAAPVPTHRAELPNPIPPGGGVIGCTTAYFLTRHKSYNPALHTITLLEATTLAAGASGKAGGLLALWAYPDCLVPLSYRLHAELAAQHNGAERWGYRRVQCGSLAFNVSRSKVDSFEREKVAATGGVVGAGEKAWEKLPKQDESAAALLREARVPEDLDWVDAETVAGYAEMGGPGTTDTAQVHPLHFTTSIAELAREGGAVIKEGAKVTEIRTGDDNGVEGVGYLDRETGEERSIDDVTDVIVCAGPWTSRVLPRAKVEGLRAHSVVFEADVSPYAIFTDISLPHDYVPAHRAYKGQRRRHKGNVDPEIYARPNNEVYACGMSPPPPNPITSRNDKTNKPQANPTAPCPSPKPPTSSK